MNIQKSLLTTDHQFINYAKRIEIPLARFAIFLVYFWFGILKVLGQSPASPMVLKLLSITMPFFSPDKFLICFGLFEMLIGILFLLPIWVHRFTRISIILLFIHMFTTILPIFVMPQYTWISFGVPTLEGQYIIKNILIIALTVVIGANLKPKEFIPLENR